MFIFNEIGEYIIYIIYITFLNIQRKLKKNYENKIKNNNIKCNNSFKNVIFLMN